MTTERQRSPFRRLDHVAIAVRDAGAAVQYFTDTLGLAVVHVEELEAPPVTLTYLDAGNAYIQLVSPRGPCDVSRWLDEHGDGLHHVCFGVDDVAASVEALSGDGSWDPGTGRGRVSAFVRNGSPFGVLIECTEFHPDDGPALDPRAGAGPGVG